MIISSHNLDFKSNHSSVHQRELTEIGRISLDKTEAWNKDDIEQPNPPSLPNLPLGSKDSSGPSGPSDSLRLTSEFGGSHKMERFSGVAPSDTTVNLDPKLTLIKAIVEQVTGRKITLMSVSQPQSERPLISQLEYLSFDAEVNLSIEEQLYVYREIDFQQQTTNFGAKIEFETTDGQVFESEIQLSMFSQTLKEEITLSGADKLKDPLIMNFSNNHAELSNQMFMVDLDVDGTPDLVPQTKSGSAFLSLDKNLNGKIDSGAELFGAVSGDGFGELSQFDVDGNGFIDEADPVFSRLMVLSFKNNGEQILQSILDKEVQAIYLGASETPFALHDSQNELSGYIRKTGFFIDKNNEAKTIQHVDLLVK